LNYLTLKRIFDFNLALFGLILFFPLIVLIAVAIFLEDGLPVLYSKKSLGKNGKVFSALKFRSMKCDSSTITKIGKLLRKTAMDELPQLINIAKGEMSFVGPRNYGINKYGVNKDFTGSKIMPASLSLDIINFSKRLEITPGLTGLAQVSAPKYATYEEVLKWDLQYIKNNNFILDLRLIFMSIWITFANRWENTSSKI
jgi:lipopolysaccharide/colanic/teichoic acid biosynthesis glycosyltransferase